MKRVIIPIAVVVVALLAVFLMLPVLFPLGSLRERLESTVNAKIDGKMEVSSLRLSTFPWLGIRLNGLTVRNGEKFQKSELLRVQHAGVRVKVLPLFRGEILGEILVEKPVIRLETLPDGQSSLAALAKPAAAAEPPPPPAKGGESTMAEKLLARLKIESLALRDGEVRSFTLKGKEESTPGLDIRKLDLHLQDLALHGEIPTHLKAAVFRTDRADVEFEGIVITDLEPDGSKQLVTIKSGSLELGEIVVRIAGTMAQTKSKPLTVDLQVESSGISLGRLGDNLPPLKSKMPAGLEGDLSLKVTAKGPIKPPEALAMDISFSSNRLATGAGRALQLTDTQFSGTFQNNVLTVKSLDSHLYDGTLHSQGTATLPGPVLALQMNVKDVNLQTAANAFSERKDLLFGTANVEMSVGGNPAAAGEKKEKALVPPWLTTKGHLNLGKGRLATLDLLGDTAKFLLKVAPLTPEARRIFESHDWNSFDADFRTADASLFLEPAVLRYPETTISLAGNVDPQQQLSFKGALILDKRHAALLGASFLYLQDKQGNVVVPMKVTGSVERPITYVDLVSIMKRATQEEIKKLVPPEVKGLLTDFLKPQPKK